MISRRSILKVAAAGGLAGGARSAGARDVLVVVEKSGHSVSFYEATSGDRLGTVALPHFPHEMVVDSARRYAYVGHYGVRMSSDTGEGGSAVFVIDLVRRTLARTIDTRPFHRIHGMGIDGGNRVYALSEAEATLLGFDHPREDTAPTRAVDTGGIKTHLFSLSRDGQRAYVTGLLSHTVSLVRPRDASIPPVVTTPGELPESSCLSPDERTLYVAARQSATLVALDARTLSVRRRLEVDGDPLRVYPLSGNRLLLTDITNNQIRVLSADLRPLWAVALDGIPSAVSLHPARPLAYVSQVDSNSVGVLDLDRRAVVGRFGTRAEPDSSVLLPGG